MSVTIIRHRPTNYGFAVVVTDFGSGFTARFQLYRETFDGRTVIEDSQSFGDEVSAVEVFDKYFLK